MSTSNQANEPVIDINTEIPVSGEQAMKVGKLIEYYRDYVVKPIRELLSEKRNMREPVKNKKEYADVVVRNQKGDILLLQRSYQDNFMPGKWGLPGGNIEPGESSEEAAQRELAEETCLTDIPLKYLATVEKDNCRIHYYEAFLDGPPFIVLDNNEHYRMEFVRPADVMAYNTILDFDSIFYNKLLPIMSTQNPFIAPDEYENDFNDREMILVQIQKAVSLELLSRGVDAGEIDDDVYLGALKKSIDAEPENVSKTYSLSNLRLYTKTLNDNQLTKALEKDRIVF